MSSLKVVHARAKCIGCNSCVVIAPQNWAMDHTEGKSRLIGSVKKRDVWVGEIFDCDLEANKRASAACPMAAIKVSR